MNGWVVIIGEIIGVVLGLAGIAAYYGFRYGWRKMYGRQGGAR